MTVAKGLSDNGGPVRSTVAVGTTIADRLQRSVIVSAYEVVPGVLPRHANSSVVGEGHAGESVGAAAGVGAGGSNATGWRAASSVRTSSRLNRAGISSGVTATNLCTADSSRGRFSDPPDGSRHSAWVTTNLHHRGRLRANHRSTPAPRRLGVLSRNVGCCCSRALADRISEKHRRSVCGPCPPT